MTSPSPRRRALLRGLPLLPASAWLSGCARDDKPTYVGGWIGGDPRRAHGLREPVAATTTADDSRRTQVLIVGAGVAGLAAARAFRQRGIEDLQVLELEAEPGGNARGHVLAGMACPQAAHYLPVPGATTPEVRDWLFEIGLLRLESGRTVADERHLCHSPQERLYIDGAWHDGLLPPHEGRPSTLAAYRRFAEAVRALHRAGDGVGAFRLPSHRARPDPMQLELDTMTFARWLDAAGLTDERLRWYLDYCCRDDYGAGTNVVSAWAGVHYFASRHGFAAPGEADAERDAVFTWPEGNAWLVRALARPLGDRLRTGCSVRRVRELRHGVEVLVLEHASGRHIAWQAQTVVLAIPLFIAARIVDNPPEALRQAAAMQPRAPWLVTNLHLTAPVLERPGVGPCWDNVVYRSSGLGYVDAMHQSLRPHPGPTVLTHYMALPMARRAELLQRPWSFWADQVLQDLSAAHPDLPRRVREVALARHGHAMAIPVPGQRASAVAGPLAALRRSRGRLRFAHADLAGYSVFEEAFTLGHEVAG